MKKLLSITLAVVMVMALLTVCAEAVASPTQGGTGGEGEGVTVTPYIDMDSVGEDIKADLEAAYKIFEDTANLSAICADITKAAEAKSLAVADLSVLDIVYVGLDEKATEKVEAGEKIPVTFDVKLGKDSKVIVLYSDMEKGADGNVSWSVIDDSLVTAKPNGDVVVQVKASGIYTFVIG